LARAVQGFPRRAANREDDGDAGSREYHGSKQGGGAHLRPQRKQRRHRHQL